MSKAYAKTRTKKNTQTATTSKQQAEQQYQQNLIRAYNTAADLHRQDVRELAQQTRGLASKMDTFDSRGTYLRNRQSVNEYQRDLDNYKAKLRQLGSYGYNTTSAIQNAGRNSYTQSVLDSIGSKYTEPKRNILDRIAGAIDRHAAMAGDPFGNGTMAPAANSTRNALERSRDTRFQNAVSAELTRRRLEQTATPKINGTRSTGSKWLDNLMNATAKVGTYDDSDASMMMGIQAEGNAASRNRFENIMRGIGSGWKAGNLGALAAVTGKRDLNTSDADMMFRAGSIGDTSGYELPGIARVKAKISKWANEQADLLDQESQDSIALAKDGLGTFGSMLVDAGIAGGQMGLDFGLSALTGGAVNSLGTMGVRVFGQANREAKRNGATDDQAFDYALGNAAVEVLTEKIGNIAAPFAAAYGAGTLDDFIKQGIQNAATTKGGRLALTTLMSAASEGLEEGISGLMNPLLEAATYGGADSLRQFQNPEFWTDLLHDVAVGALMGGFGMAGDAVSVASQQMQQNAADRSLGRTITEAEYTQRLMEANVIQQNQRAGEIAAQLQNAKSGSRRADLLTGRLYNAVNEGETRSAMANRLMTLGVDAETAPTIASGILNEIKASEAGNEVIAPGATRAELAAMQQYEKQTNRVRTEYEDALEGDDQSSNAWARELGSQQFGRAMDISFAAAERAQRAEEGTTEEAAPKAETLAVNEQEGVQNNGQSVLPGGSQRYDGQSAGGEVRQLEEGAGRDQSREAWGRPADREIAQSAAPAQQKTVSSRQIHPAGIDSDNLYQPEVKTKAMKRAEKWAKQHGKKAVFFAGDMLTVQHTMPDGNVENVRVRGMIDGDTIYLRADDAQFTSEQIAKHETTHDLLDTGRISRDAVKAALQARYTPEEIDNICHMYAEAYAGMDDAEAWDEIICDAMGGMNIFARSDSQGKAVILRDILDSIYEEANKDYEARKGKNETRAEEREEGPKFSRDSERLRDEAEQDIVETLGSDADVETNEDGQLVIAKSADKHTIAFSRVTLENGGREKLRKALEENGHSNEEILDMLKRIDDAIDFIADLGVKYEGRGYENLQRNFYADIITDVRTHKQVLSTLVRNGDYPVNLDLALVCKKRVAYMRMIARLVNDGVLDQVTFGGDAIAKVNDILREKGFETACLGCFVESRRLQIQSWAETIVNEWNRQVDQRRKNAPDFGFAAGRTAKLSTDELAAIEREYAGAKLNEKGNKKLKQADVENKIGQLLDTTPSLLQHLRVEDLLTPQGITALRQRDGSLFSLVQQRYGAASPKIVQDFNPYNGEIADLSFKFIKDRNGEGIKGSKKYIDQAKKKLGGTPKKMAGETNAEFAERKREFNRQAENMAMRQYLYDIGGARMQSFSDFMIENVFDYIQMFADLAAKRLPMHGYSKEIVALRLFGMTGAKWNGSLIAHTSRSMGKEFAGLMPVEEASNGRGVVVTDPMTGERYAICFDDYQRHKATGSFIQSIGMKDIFALQLDPRYSKNVGSITIGVSDAQIRAMLNHPLFSMVIPYHSSGMLPEYAARVGVDMYNDYTDYQNTRPGTAYDKDGNEVESLRAGDKVLHADTHFDFNEAVQRLGDAKLAAKEYLDWCEEKHPVYNGKTLIGYETFLPKFSDSPEHYDFTQEENYYKLLEDFTSYDAITGESAVQGDVMMTFPEENGLSDAEVEAYKDRLRETGIYTEKEIDRYAERAQMSFKDIVRESVEERYQYQKATEPTWEETVQAVKDALLGDESARSTPEERQQKRDEKKAKEKAKKEQHFSREMDSDYMAAVEAGDTREASWMVEAAALDWGAILGENGFPLKMYHGTGAFGFTVFDTSKSDDGISLFTTDNLNTAKSYSGNTNRNRISEASTIDADSFSAEELLEEAKKHYKKYDDYRLLTGEEKQKEIKDERDVLEYHLEQSNRFADEHGNEPDIFWHLNEALGKMSKAQSEDELQEAWDNWDAAVWELKFTDEDLAMDYLEAVDSQGLFMTKNRLADLAFYSGNVYIDSWNSNYVFDNQLILEVDADLHKGVYELYGRAGRQLVIDAEGANWNAIVPPEELNLYGTQRTRDIATAAKAAGYDSIVFKNLRDNGGETAYNGLSNVYVFFNANQLKSADPVTYDDDGNVIPLSERFNSEKTDIRFSREATNLREANREIEKLRTMADYWRGQTQRTTRENAGPNERDVLDVSKALVKDYDSTEDAQSIRADIRELARYIMRGEPKTHDVRFETVSDMAYRIAQKVVEPTMEVEPFEGMGEQIRKDLRDANIDMTTVKGDFAEGWREVMQITRGKIKNKKGGAGIDTFWMEMQERYGTGAFPEDITNPADQLRYMAELYDQTQTQEIRKPESAYYEEVMWCRNDIIDKVLGEEIRQAPPTKMDKALEKADASKRAAVSRERERLARQAEKFAKEKKDYADKARKVKNEALERQERKLKEHFREVQKNQRERRSKTALWRRILAKKNDFLQLKAKPGQAASRHAPAELANALAAVADCFNIENRKRTVNAKGLTKSLADLSKVYEAMKGDERNGVYYDEGLADFLKQTATAFGSFEADALTLDELERMDKLLRSFHHTITHANQFMTRQWSIGLIEAGRKWTREVMEAAPVLKGLAGDLLNFQLRPDSFFARLSGFAKNSVGEQVQKMFADSTERMLTVQRAFYQNFREYSEDKRFDKLTARGKKDLVDVGLKDVDGNKVLLTRDMMLAVYKHLSSQDNLEAAAYGGLEIPDLDKYYTGKVAAAFDNDRMTAHADYGLSEILKQLRDQQELARNAETEADRAAAEEAAEQLEEQIRQVREEALQTMLNVRAKTSKMLTDYEKKLIEASESWMDQSAAYINEVTMNMYGFEKANVPKYWPMHRDTNFVQTDMRNAENEINLENWGSLKERVKSHAPIKLTGFIFELDNHTVKMSRYYGFAEAQRDFNKLYNTQLPGSRTSLSKQIHNKYGSYKRKLGVSGQQYIDAYLASISGANEVNTSFFSLIRRNLPRATLTINLRVAVSQLASIPTAAGEIGWGAMLKGMPRGFKTAFSTKAKNELAEKNVWFWQRYRGEGGMREFADMKEEQNWFDRGWNRLAGTKVGKLLFNWCQDFDVFATASMWAMSEEYVKSNTDLKPGTEEFDQRVGEVYRDVIRKTQPNYTETERSDLLRDKREGMKFLTMYKTQSNQNLNIVYEASARFAQYKRDLKNGKNGVTKADVDQAGKQLARAYTAVLLGGTLAFSILRAAANAILHNMNAYRDDDDEVTLEGILNGILDETIGAFAGMFAFGSEIESAVMAIIKKEKYWGLTDSAVSALSDLVEKSVDAIQKATDADKDLSRDDVEKLVRTWAQIMGIPYDNGKKIYEGVWGHIEDIQNGEFLSFESGVQRTGKTEAKKLVDAMLDGDKEKAEKAWEHLLETKADKKDPEGTAQNAVKDHLKDLYFDDGISEKQMKKLLKTLGWDDDAKIDEFVTSAKCKKETGYAPGDLKEGYLDGAFGDKKAIQYLKEYKGKDADEAEETLNYWKMNKKYGFDYNDTGDMYAKGKISEKEAKTILMTYGDYSEEDADDKVLKWGVNKEYGFDYDDTREQYVKGNISGEEAAEIWSKYGGMDDEKIADRLLTADFLAEHPEVDEENVTANRVELYDLIGKGANIPADKFMEYAKKVKTFHGEVDAKGKSIPYSTQDKIIAWINTLDLSPAQKTAVFATYFDEGKIPTNSYKRIKW